MLGNWFLESLIHFFRNLFIPRERLLLNVTFLLATELRSQKKKKQSLYATIIKCYCSPYFD